MAAAHVDAPVAALSAEFCEYERSEPLLKENTRRWVMFPVEYPNLYDMYKKHTAAFWTAEDVDVAQDVQDFEGLSEDEKRFVRHVLALFLTFDKGILADSAGRMSTEIQSPEARGFYGFQITMESIHAEATARIMGQLVRDKEERSRLMEAARAMPAVEERMAWASTYLDPKRSFTERLLAFACVQSLFRSGAYCALFSLKERGVMPGLTFANERIARDKCMHADFAALLYSMLEHRLPEDVAHGIVRGAVDAEKKFICESLPCDLLGVSGQDMRSYVEHAADQLLAAFGHAKVFNVGNPFKWAASPALPDKEHFAEKKDAKSSAEPREEVFTMEEDF